MPEASKPIASPIDTQTSPNPPPIPHHHAERPMQFRASSHKSCRGGVGDRQSVPHGTGVLGGGACPCPLMQFAIFIAIHQTRNTAQFDSPFQSPMLISSPHPAFNQLSACTIPDPGIICNSSHLPTMEKRPSRKFSAISFIAIAKLVSIFCMTSLTRKTPQSQILTNDNLLETIYSGQLQVLQIILSN